ncbi:MAG: hypothetical protein N4A72_07995 [Bacteroidales bacterium]|jgi:hypothetical protein|nr:hypothetical protein [Bacteroidales bacterium]
MNIEEEEPIKVILRFFRNLAIMFIVLVIVGLLVINLTEVKYVKISEEYPDIKNEHVLCDKISGFYSPEGVAYRGSPYVKYFQTVKGKKYRLGTVSDSSDKYLLEDILHIHDSIVKKKNSVNIYIKKSNSERVYSFILDTTTHKNTTPWCFRLFTK